jgi:molecular chaperone GrpE
MSDDPEGDGLDGDGVEGVVDTAGAPPDSERGIEAVPLTMQQEIDALKRERDELRDLLLRRRAEFDNYKKRVERDRVQAGVEANANVLKTLVPTLDNLDRALETGADPATLRSGVELIRRDLLATLESHGVTSEDPLGQTFDPERHQALAHEPAPGYAEGVVSETFRKGYLYKDRLLRPALVKVAKASEPGPEAVH